jgi:ATP-binding cassette subfamily F protein uup
LKKDLARVERQVTKSKETLALLKAELEAAAFDSGKLLQLSEEIAFVESELAQREEEWLEITLALEK